MLVHHTPSGAVPLLLLSATAATTQSCSRPGQENCILDVIDGNAHYVHVMTGLSRLAVM